MRWLVWVAFLAACGEPRVVLHLRGDVAASGLDFDTLPAGRTAVTPLVAVASDRPIAEAGGLPGLVTALSLSEVVGG